MPIPPIKRVLDLCFYKEELEDLCHIINENVSGSKGELTRRLLKAQIDFKTILDYANKDSLYLIAEEFNLNSVGTKDKLRKLITNYIKSEENKKKK